MNLNLVCIDSGENRAEAGNTSVTYVRHLGTLDVQRQSMIAQQSTHYFGNDSSLSLDPEVNVGVLELKFIVNGSVMWTGNYLVQIKLYSTQQTSVRFFQHIKQEFSLLSKQSKEPNSTSPQQ